MMIRDNITYNIEISHIHIRFLENLFSPPKQ